MKFLSSFISYILAGSGEGVLNPIYSGISIVGPYALSIVVTLSLFYAVFLGVKYAKAKDEQERAGAQKTLINFVIGAGVVIVLIAVLYAIRGPLAAMIDGR